MGRACRAAWVLRVGLHGLFVRGRMSCGCEAAWVVRARPHVSWVWGHMGHACGAVGRGVRSHGSCVQGRKGLGCGAVWVLGVGPNALRVGRIGRVCRATWVACAAFRQQRAVHASGTKGWLGWPPRGCISLRQEKSRGLARKSYGQQPKQIILHCC